MFVDVGNKSIGLQALQAHLGMRPDQMLHVGDRFTVTGNDNQVPGPPPLPAAQECPPADCTSSCRAGAWLLLHSLGGESKRDGVLCRNAFIGCAPSIDFVSFVVHFFYGAIST